MAQQNWHLQSGWGQRHLLGLYHGTDSGHLVVHLNNKVLLIDFNVLETKMYSFFIDQDLYELQIKRSGQDFSYDLQVNTEVDTPKNNERKQAQKTETRNQLLVVAFTIVLFAILIIVFSFLPDK